MVAFKPYAEYDKDADAVYVRLKDTPVARSVPLDDCRIIDYAEDGAVVGVEFLGAGGGVGLSDIPFRQKVEHLIGELGQGLKIFA